MLAVALLIPAAVAAEDPFAQDLRPTAPLTPAAQQKTFHLPPGFEIQLVAAEPDIQKPINLAFDARGRIWVTGSVEYPLAAPPDRKGRDTIKILEDSDGDGRAERITTFADGLNIPVGVYPYRDGCIVWSIANIIHLRDTDGDGRADERGILYGPFGQVRDTHGMSNSFRRVFDGWVYACHGFNNESVVRGTDGHTVSMQSGNTYRFRLDGSRIEQFTWGQVNPFGMAADGHGNFFTADCHSSPIYQLVRGGYYPSSGKPHDGLGFVSPMMVHSHGSTGISGCAYYTGDNFPPAFRGNIFVGNVVTSRVNRDTLVYHGSTVEACEAPDFVRSEDPWFRPVDLRVGPDGALYIADFYNRIIGHYELPLTHPGRDRKRGRIWRVVYTAADNARPDEATATARLPRDLSRASTAALIEALGHATLSCRALAATELVDRIGAPCVDAVDRAVRTAPLATVRIHGLWVLQRLDALSPELLRAAAVDPAESVRVHAMRILAEMSTWSDEQQRVAVAALENPSPFVARAAAEAVGLHPRFGSVDALLALLRRVPASDAYLRHTARIALREQLRHGDGLKRLLGRELAEADSRVAASVAVSIHSPDAGAFLIRHLGLHQESRDVTTDFFRHAARNVPADSVAEVARFAREGFGGDIELQRSLLVSITKGLDQRGVKAGKEIFDWGSEVAGALLVPASRRSDWTGLALPGTESSQSPWVLQNRASVDGDRSSVFLSSLPLGERLTGVLRSAEFTIPSLLTFFAAGHVGPPGEPVDARNFIRLRLAGSEVVVVEATPPRHDIARRVEWKLDTWAGKTGYLEIVDGDTRSGYAWLAVGRFDPPVVSMPSIGPGRVSERARAGAELVGQLGLAVLRPELERVVLSTMVESSARGAAAKALLALRPDTTLAALVSIIGDDGLPGVLREKVCSAFVGRDAVAVGEVLAEALRTAPARVQISVARSLADSRAGVEVLLGLVEKGHASPRLLRKRSVLERVLAVGTPAAAARVEALTVGLPAQSESIGKLMRQRLELFARSRPDLGRGAELFTKNCSACHKIGETGGTVAPGLDGIGNRGAERLVEDILDSNRNVDVAFRATTFFLTDGTVITGLFRREEGKTLVVADIKGKEITIAASRVLQRIKGAISLMPDNFGEVMTPAEFRDLLAFLLSKRK